jgi:hypothetical protein
MWYSLVLLCCPPSMYSTYSSAMSFFKPREAVPITPSVLLEFLGTYTLDVAKQFVRRLAPIAPHAVIHDNGCGGGAVTQAIMAIDPLESTRNKATDMNATVLSALAARVATESWPV